MFLTCVRVRLLRSLMSDLVNPESGEEMIWLPRVKAMLSCTLVPSLSRVCRKSSRVSCYGDDSRYGKIIG